MGCNGCGEKSSGYTFFDRHGNPRNQPVQSKVGMKEAVESLVSYDGTPLMDKNIDQMLADKKRRREALLAQSQEFVVNMTDDMKRAAILDLIDVYNCDEFMMTYTSPNQALAALYRYVHNPAFAQIISEFEGLAEQVDLKYKELQEKRISFHWNRK